MPKKHTRSPAVRTEASPSWLQWAPWGILVLHLLLAVAYNLATPFGNNGYANTPDEGAHFQYVAFVAREWRLPLFEGYEGVGYEAHQPPLYYFLAGMLYHLVGGEGKGVRLLSTLCSLGVVWLVYWTVRWLFPERPLLALGAMAFVAFLPMHIAIGSAVGNDALTNLLFAGALFLSAILLTEKPTARHLFGLGIVVGLALLTKATAVLLLPISAVAVGLSALRHSAGWGGAVQHTGLVLTIALAIGGWWFVRNAMLYNDPLLQRTFVEVFAGTARAQDFLDAGMSFGDYLRLVANWTFRSFWFAYGTPRTASTGLPNFLPDSVYWGLLLWQVLVVVGLVRGLLLWQVLVVVGLVRRWRMGFTQAQRDWLWIALLTLGLVALTFFLFIRVFFQAQGRYFYPALLPIAVLNLLGWEGLIPDKWRTTAFVGLMFFWLALAVGCWRYLG